MDRIYPVDAHAPGGELWWLLRTWPGRRQRFGAEVKVAAWIRFNLDLGDVFTLRELRQAIPTADDEPNDDEHFNRRVRALRTYGWELRSKREEDALAPNEYRLTKTGDPIWLGKAQFGRPAVSQRLRRTVLDRDGNRCVLCGVGSGEAYPGEPSSKAVLTVGHFRANALEGEAGLDNLRAECSRCNEPMRDELSSGETADDVWPRLRRLKAEEKRKLLSWIDAGQRTRSDLDREYDSVRVLPPGQRDALRSRLAQAIGTSE
jgi:hypothetical protein